jgi:ABC-type branched-subunit amino acid transport system substrate-binding protein
MRSLRTLGTRRPASVAVAAALAIVAAACGGGTSTPVASLTDTSAWVRTGPTTGPSTGWSDGGYKVDAPALKCTQPATNETRGITDTSITVEGLAYLTSPGGVSMTGVDVGAKVRFDAANDAGGINGRKIVFRGVLDDAQDSSRDLAQSKVLAEQDNAFAAVPVVTSASAYAGTFCSQKVPFFGWGTNNGFCGSAVGFGITGCNYNVSVPANNLAGLVNSMFPAGTPTNHTIAIIGQDIDSSRAAVTALKDDAQAGGLKVVYASSSDIPESGITDATALVNTLMTANAGSPPDVVYYITDFGSTLKLIQALGADGFKGKNLSPIYDPALTGIKQLDGMYATGSWLSGIDTENAAANQMVADFKKYAPDQRISIAALAGYWSADLFVAAATAAGRDLTVDKLVSFLNTGYVHAGAGAVPETRWPLNHVVTTPCSSVAQLTGGAWKSVTQLSCGSLLVAKPAKS